MSMPEGSLLAPQDLLDDEDHVLLLVPDAHGRRRKAVLRALRDSGAVAGPDANSIGLSPRTRTQVLRPREAAESALIGAICGRSAKKSA